MSYVGRDGTVYQGTEPWSFSKITRLFQGVINVILALSSGGDYIMKDDEFFDVSSPMLEAGVAKDVRSVHVHPEDASGMGGENFTTLIPGLSGRIDSTQSVGWGRGPRAPPPPGPRRRNIRGFGTVSDISPPPCGGGGGG